MKEFTDQVFTVAKDANLSRIIAERDPPIRSYLQQSKKTLAKLRQNVVVDKDEKGGKQVINHEQSPSKASKLSS
jgi:hypothetical protein